MENVLFWAAQVVSVAAACCTIGSFQCRSNEKLMLWQLVGGVLWTLHFALLGAWAACFSNAVAIFRAFAARRMYRRGTRDYGVLAALLVLMALAAVVGAVLGWNGAGYSDWVPLWLGRTLCIIMVLSNLSSTLAMWSKNGRIIRVVQLCIVSPLWLLNNLCTFSVFGVATEVFSIVSVIVSMIRYRKEKLT